MTRADYMDVEFDDPTLDRLETDRSFNAGFCDAIVRGYRKALGVIRAATDERDLYSMKSLHFKKLDGNRSHQRSMRLNDQWRLILTIKTSSPKNIVVVVKIEDYH
jgi:proteic killer suppression protein